MRGFQTSGSCFSWTLLLYFWQLLSYGLCLCTKEAVADNVIIKWKITLSRWLWQSIGGESRNFWSITIPALFESSVEHLITLLGASSRTKAFATVQRFFRAPMESIALYALFGSYSRIFDHNIRHRVSVCLWYVPSHMVGHIRWGLIQSDRVNITKKTFGI